MDKNVLYLENKLPIDSKLPELETELAKAMTHARDINAVLDTFFAASYPYNLIFDLVGNSLVKLGLADKKSSNVLFNLARSEYIEVRQNSPEYTIQLEAAFMDIKDYVYRNPISVQIVKQIHRKMSLLQSYKSTQGI